MSERFGRAGALAAVLALGLGLASTAGAQSYLSNPNRDDFINAFGRSADAPPATDEQGVRRKGTTRGLQINVPAATATRPSAEAMPAPNRLPSLNFPVHFEFNSAELTVQARSVLDELGLALSSDELRPYRFRIVGHSDAVGPDDYNLHLSERRARAVERYLKEKFGIEPHRLHSIGMGESQPYDARNPNAAVNRRVEIVREGRIGG